MFQVIDPQNSAKLPKNQLWRKANHFKILLPKDSSAHEFTYSCQVSWKSVKQKWQNRCMVFVIKNFGILPLSLELLERYRQKFYSIYTQKCLPDSLQSYRLLADYEVLLTNTVTVSGFFTGLFWFSFGTTTFWFLCVLSSFLQGVSIACYVEPCINHRRDICLSGTDPQNPLDIWQDPVHP